MEVNGKMVRFAKIQLACSFSVYTLHRVQYTRNRSTLTQDCFHSIWLSETKHYNSIPSFIHAVNLAFHVGERFFQKYLY